MKAREESSVDSGLHEVSNVEPASGTTRKCSTCLVLVFVCLFA